VAAVTRYLTKNSLQIIAAAAAKPYPAENDKPVTRGELKSLLEEVAGLKTCAATAHTKRSWASVAAGPPALGRAALGLPAPGHLLVPARRTREVIIGDNNADKAIRARTAPETVEAINRAIGSEDAIAVRRLPSENTVIIFKEGASLSYKTNEA